MQYQLIQPPAALRPYVRYLWTLDCDLAVNSEQVLRILADRHPRLIIQHLEGHSAIRNQSGERLPASFLSGVASRPFIYRIQGVYSHTGVSFYPHGLHRIFGIEAVELTNEWADLSHFCPRSLRERISLAASHSERVTLLARFLLEKLQVWGRDDTVLNEYLLGGSFDPVQASIPVLLHQYGWSERQLERKFRIAVGVPPRTYLRILKFEKALEQLRTCHFGKLQDIAFNLNYADHSHFTREFKQFSGYTPKAFLAEQRVAEVSTSFLVGENNLAQAVDV